MTAARTLRPAFRALTWKTLIGLLAVTGCGRARPAGSPAATPA